MNTNKVQLSIEAICNFLIIVNLNIYMSGLLNTSNKINQMKLNKIIKFVVIKLYDRNIRECNPSNFELFIYDVNNLTQIKNHKNRSQRSS